MFRGLHMMLLDAKGRMAMPARYRQEVDNVWVLTIDPETRCLLLYPKHSWEAIERQLESLPSFNPAARRIQRLLLGHATELECDAQGRILVPALLRDYAGLEREALLIGQGKKFELWQKDLWDRSREDWLSSSPLQSMQAEIPEAMKQISL